MKIRNNEISYVLRIYLIFCDVYLTLILKIVMVIIFVPTFRVLIVWSLTMESLKCIKGSIVIFLILRWCGSLYWLNKFVSRQWLIEKRLGCWLPNITLALCAIFIFNTMISRWNNVRILDNGANCKISQLVLIS